MSLLTDIEKAAHRAVKRAPSGSVLAPGARLAFVIGYLEPNHPRAAKALELILDGVPAGAENPPTQGTQT